VSGYPLSLLTTPCVTFVVVYCLFRETISHDGREEETITGGGRIIQETHEEETEQTVAPEEEETLRYGEREEDGERGREEG